MDHIRIFRISDEVFRHKGFDERGCYGCSCNDSCCRYGCDVDKESFELILANRQIIEETVGIRLEDCFETEWSNDDDFLGKNSIRATKRGNYCAFHFQDGRGCVLFRLVFNEGLPKRIIPSICRLYPLSWDKGEIHMYAPIECTCNCVQSDNMGMKNIMETQKEQVRDIFEIFTSHQ